MVCVDIEKKVKTEVGDCEFFFERFRVLRMFHVKQKKKIKRLRDTVIKNRGSECTI